VDHDSARLQVVIARHGIASRRKVEDLIRQGRVTVNGRVVTRMGTKVNPGHDSIKVDGKLLVNMQPNLYAAFYKPAGVVTTMDRQDDRPTVAGLIESRVKGRLFPVGRLDFDAEGLLILTNDGIMAHKLMHPSFMVPRIYLAKVKGTPSTSAVKKLESGIRLKDGIARAEKVTVKPTGKGNAWVRLVVREGRGHLVKRLLDALGFPVLRLKRTGYGGIRLKGLKPGELRFLDDSEVMTMALNFGKQNDLRGGKRVGRRQTGKAGKSGLAKKG